MDEYNKHLALLSGMMQAFSSLLDAMIATHPNPEKLLSDFQICTELQDRCIQQQVLMQDIYYNVESTAHAADIRHFARDAIINEISKAIEKSSK